MAETINIDERMTQITTQLQQQPQGLDFADLFTVSASDEMLVTTFMAVLELTKQDQVALQQAEPLSPIHLYLRQDEQHDEH